MEKPKAVRRKAKRVPTSTQQPLSLGAIAPRPKPGENEVRAEPIPDFIEDDPTSIRIGQMRLDTYLRETGFASVLKMRDFMKSLDWSCFFGAYGGAGRPGGRKPIHPRILLSLFVYGAQQGTSTLRELEALARKDVAAWFLCDGLQPDHSTIGRFIAMHAELLSEEFFTSLTQELVERAGATGKAFVAAGDGTVVWAAGSQWKLMKADAIRGQANAAAAEGAAEKAAALNAAADIAQARSDAREAAGKKEVRVTPAEPEAMVQMTKEGVAKASYKPSVLTNATGLIVGQYVDPSNETAALRPMLKQYQAVMGVAVSTLALDAGYFNTETLTLALEEGLNALIPSGKADEKGDFEKRGRGGLIPKSSFKYDEARATYVCPAGREMAYDHTSTVNGERYVEFRGLGCATCPLATQCTKAKSGVRRVKRLAGDEVKDAMREVLKQPAARRDYGLRQALVEPIFGRLKHNQELRRFRRRGLMGARVEFALHAIAYNLAMGLSGRSNKTVVVVRLLIRMPGAPWRPIWGAIVAHVV